MTQFILKRLLALVPVLFGVSLVVFAMIHLTPGDPARLVMGSQPVSAEAVDELRERLGLNRPLHEQYLSFLAGALQGDLGDSFYSRRPVTQEILERLPVTGSLTVFAVFLTLLIGIPAGVLAAARHDTILDYGTMAAAVLGVSIPSFWLGLMLILLFAVHLGWLPVAGVGGFKYYILPGIALAGGGGAVLARLTRSSVLETLGNDYVRTARAKGLSERVVLYRHALRNALIPVVTVVGLQAGSLLAGAVIIETVFALPGLGRLAIHAISGRDYPLVQGIVLFMAVVYTLVNFAVDLVYGLINPRIRYE